MPATTRATAKAAVSTTSPAPDAGALSDARARTLTVHRSSPLLYRLVVGLPLLSLLLTLLFRVHSWDAVLTQQLLVVIAMSVGAYLATRHLVPLYVPRPPHHTQLHPPL